MLSISSICSIAVFTYNIQNILDNNLPVSPKELAVGGREMVSLGLKGPAIGQMQNELIQAVHAGKVENESSDLMNYINMMLGVQ